MPGQIHENQGHGHDQKYSDWRRDTFPIKAKRRDAYCTDIDWVEWRNGRPVAFLECRRVIGSLTTSEDVITHFKTFTNGFQLEVYARLAYYMKARAFLVAIDDPESTAKNYNRATFTIMEVIPPNSWPSGRLDLNTITTRIVGKLNEDEYVQFISGL